MKSKFLRLWASLCLVVLISTTPLLADSIIKKSNPGGKAIFATMVNSTTGVDGTGLTGAAVGTPVTCTAGVAGSLTITYSIGGAAFANCLGAVTELGGGSYSYVPTATETNTTLDVLFHFAATGYFIDKERIQVNTYKVDDLGNGLIPVQSTIAAGSSGLAINTNYTAPNINSAKGMFLVFTSGANAAQAFIIGSNTTGASSVFTLLTAPAANPAAADTFDIVTGVGAKVVDLLAGTLGVTVTTNNDKTGYSLTQTFPANFSSQSIDGSGRVLLQPTQAGVTIPTVTTVGTLTTYTGNTPQTGDAFLRLGATPPTLAQIDASTIAHVTLVDTVTTYTGNTPQTGDSFARIGAAGAGLTAVPLTSTGDATLASLHAMITANVFTAPALANAPSGTGASASTIATAVWQDLLASADFSTLNSIGAWLKAPPAGFFTNSGGGGGDTPGTTTLLTRIPGVVQPQTGDSYARLGAPSGASIDADVLSRMVSFTLPTNFSSLAITTGGAMNLNLLQALDLTQAPVTTNTVGTAMLGSVSGLCKITIIGSTMNVYDATGATLLKSFTITPTPTAGSKQ